MKPAEDWTPEERKLLVKVLVPLNAAREEIGPLRAFDMLLNIVLNVSYRVGLSVAIPAIERLLTDLRKAN